MRKLKFSSKIKKSSSLTNEETMRRQNRELVPEVLSLLISEKEINEEELLRLLAAKGFSNQEAIRQTMILLAKWEMVKITPTLFSQAIFSLTSQGRDILAQGRDILGEKEQYDKLAKKIISNSLKELEEIISQLTTARDNINKIIESARQMAQELKAQKKYVS